MNTGSSVRYFPLWNLTRHSNWAAAWKRALAGPGAGIALMLFATAVLAVMHALVRHVNQSTGNRETLAELFWVSRIERFETLQ